MSLSAQTCTVILEKVAAMALKPSAPPKQGGHKSMGVGPMKTRGATFAKAQGASGSAGSRMAKAPGKLSGMPSWMAGGGGSKSAKGTGSGGGMGARSGSINPHRINPGFKRPQARKAISAITPKRNAAKSYKHPSQGGIGTGPKQMSFSMAETRKAGINPAPKQNAVAAKLAPRNKGARKPKITMGKPVFSGGGESAAHKLTRKTLGGPLPGSKGSKAFGRRKKDALIRKTLGGNSLPGDKKADMTFSLAETRKAGFNKKPAKAGSPPSGRGFGAPYADGSKPKAPVIRPKSNKSAPTGGAFAGLQRMKQQMMGKS